MDVEVWADDVRGFCAAVGIEHPVVPGWSFGAMVAMAYATRHPGHPAKLVRGSTMPRLREDLRADHPILSVLPLPRLGHAKTARRAGRPGRSGE